VPEEKKNPREESMEKKCIILVAAAIIGKGGTLDQDVTCLGPECGQYAEFASKCGFSR
jgi:hypothetical protein